MLVDLDLYNIHITISNIKWQQSLEAQPSFLGDHPVKTCACLGNLPNLLDTESSSDICLSAALHRVHPERPGLCRCAPKCKHFTLVTLMSTCLLWGIHHGIALGAAVLSRLERGTFRIAFLSLTHTSVTRCSFILRALTGRHGVLCGNR